MLHVRNGAITSKHIFAGTSRIATRVITAEQAPRERELDGSESLGGLTVETTSSVMGSSSPDTGTSSAPPGKSTLGKAANDSTFADSGHPGKGLANRSDRANEVARNTEKNPHLSGSNPGQGVANRSDRANERAKNTNKNPHLIGGGDGGDGGTPPDTGTPGGGNGGGDSGGGSAGAGADFLYYYHPDHLGSTGYVTDVQGQLYEHVLYFPFGETWVEQASNTWRTPYLYTSKELDPETGLYYFGARYYDPRTSVWQSADPILGEYLPNRLAMEQRHESWDPESDLRGYGGVYNTVNLSLYTYGAHSPLKYIDPDGNGIWGKLIPKDKTQLKQLVRSISRALSGKGRAENENNKPSSIRFDEDGVPQTSDADVPSNPVPQKARDVLKEIEARNGAAPKGYKGGRNFENHGRGGQRLPTEDAQGNPITYKALLSHKLSRKPQGGLKVG